MFQNTRRRDPDPPRRRRNSTTGATNPSVVQDVAAFRTGVVNLTGGDVPEQLPSAQVSADYFRLFGAPDPRGRTFTSEEDLAARRLASLLISHGFWDRRFAADPQIARSRPSRSAAIRTP